MTDLEHALARAQAGDPRGFEEIYRALAGPLLSYLATKVRRREDAEDVVGQVFLEALRGIARFDGDASGLRGWLFCIARDRAVDLARQQDRRPEAPISAASEPVGMDSPEASVIDRLERDRLWAAVRALPEQQREVIVLRLGSGLSSSEIARVLGKETGAVKALQHRALANLARTLSADEPGQTHQTAAEAVPTDQDPSL